MPAFPELAKIQAVVSDWDDNKVKTVHAVSDIVDRFALSIGSPKPGLEGLVVHWGKPVKKIVSELWPSNNDEDMYLRYKAFVPKDFMPYPIEGVEKAINELSVMGYIQGIVSSSSSDVIKRTIANHYPTVVDTYLFIHGASDTEYHKPDPRVFDPAMEILNARGITERQTLYTGDSIGDYLAARDRGMHFIATLNGHTKREQFVEVGLNPGLILGSFAELPEFMKENNSH